MFRPYSEHLKYVIVYLLGNILTFSSSQPHSHFVGSFFPPIITPSKYFPQSSLVVSGEDVIDVKVKIDGLYENAAFASLEIDADEAFDLCDGDTVRIKRAEHEVAIIRVSDRSFYQTLREKLSETDFNA